MKELCSVLSVASIVLQSLHPRPEGMLVAVTFAILAVAWRKG